MRNAFILPPPTPSSVVSRKIHGTGAPEDPRFDIPLPLNVPVNGTPGVECRVAGHTEAGAEIDHQLVFTFPVAVSFSSATSWPPGVVDSSSGNNTATVKVNLKSVNNGQKITVTLVDVNDGENSGDVPIQMGVLLGDVNASGVVTSGDTNLCKAQGLQPVTADNVRNDVNASGAITTGDVNIIKQNALSQLPSPP